MDTEQRFLRAETAYISSIPAEAVEKRMGRRADYFLKGKNVGLRYFLRSGELVCEYSFRNGVKHGWFYRWHEAGKLLSAAHYENGVEHGTAYQWGRDGRVIGTYTMEHGTGIDLWWQDRSDIME